MASMAEVYSKNQSLIYKYKLALYFNEVQKIISNIKQNQVVPSV